MTYRELAIAIQQCRSLAMDQGKDMAKDLSKNPVRPPGTLIAGELLARLARLEYHLQRAYDFAKELGEAVDL